MSALICTATTSGPSLSDGFCLGEDECLDLVDVEAPPEAVVGPTWLQDRLLRRRGLSLHEAFERGFAWAVRRVTPRALSREERSQLVPLLVDLLFADMARPADGS